MRTGSGAATARTRTQFESNLPKSGQVQPTPIEVEKNDRIVDDPFEVFSALVELSGIDKTPEQILSEIGAEKYVDANGNARRYSKRRSEWLSQTGLAFDFLINYYDGQYAFVKVGDREIYGRVSVEGGGQYKMPTRLGTLVMPYMFINTQRERVECFFPIKALLTGNEQGLFSMYRYCGVNEDVRDQLEKEILANIVKLSTATPPKTVIESNQVFNDIEQLCQNAGTVKNLTISDGKLVISFDWRIATDNDGVENNRALPPFDLSIDLMNGAVRGNGELHPHIMSDFSLCMGGTLRDLAQRCVREKDLYSLVCGMIQFGNSRTSSDVSGGSRHPANCIKRAIGNGFVSLTDIEQLPREMIQSVWDTLHLKFNDYHDFFSRVLSDNEG